MKNLTTPLCIGLLYTIIISCQPQQKSVSDLTASAMLKPVTLKDVSSSWTQLTENDGQLVIYHPCDANNTVVEVREDTLYINWGQEEGFYTITSVKNSSTGKLILSAKSDYGEEEDTFAVEFLDDEKKQARWFVWLNDSTSEIFTDTRLVSQYREVRQPCRECWGKDVCDEAEKADSLEVQ
jgi:hypothetical protein